jgi:hypothetical protein
VIVIAERHPERKRDVLVGALELRGELCVGHGVHAVVVEVVPEPLDEVAAVRRALRLHRVGDVELGQVALALGAEGDEAHDLRPRGRAAARRSAARRSAAGRRRVVIDDRHDRARSGQTRTPGPR